MARFYISGGKIYEETAARFVIAGDKVIEDTPATGVDVSLTALAGAGAGVGQTPISYIGISLVALAGAGAGVGQISILDIGSGILNQLRISSMHFLRPWEPTAMADS
jgi:hypothetical protein